MCRSYKVSKIVPAPALSALSCASLRSGHSRPLRTKKEQHHLIFEAVFWFSHGIVMHSGTKRTSGTYQKIRQCLRIDVGKRLGGRQMKRDMWHHVTLHKHVTLVDVECPCISCVWIIWMSVYFQSLRQRPLSACDSVTFNHKLRVWCVCNYDVCVCVCLA